MFVRWKRRRMTARKRPTGDVVKTAALVRSERTPAGPRLRHVCYLGSIEDKHLDSASARGCFWDKATKSLDAAGIGGEVRQRIEAAIATAVPRPTAMELEKARAEHAAFMESFRGALGR